MNAARVCRVSSLVVLFATTLLAQGVDAEREAMLLRQVSTGSDAARRTAILAARSLETPKLVARITEIARTAKPLSLRWNAIDTLGHYRNEDGTKVLLGMLRELRENGADARLIAATYEALGRRRDPTVFDVLVKALKEDVLVMRGAAKGLGLLADKRAYDSLLTALRPYELALIHGLDILRAMLAADRTRAVRFFCAEMRDGETPRPYRYRFERLLSTSPGPDVADAARDLLRAGYPDAVHRGLRILGACRRTKDVPVITKILHAKPAHRLACVQALTKMAHDLTVQDLLRYLADDNRRVRAEVAHALGKIGAKRATPHLVRRLRKDEDLRTRIRVVEALGRIRDPRAVASLMPLLDDRSFVPDARFSSMRSPFPGNTQMRYAALWSLQHIRDGKADFDLLLENPNRWEAAVPAAEFAAWQEWWKGKQKDKSFRIQNVGR